MAIDIDTLIRTILTAADTLYAFHPPSRRFRDGRLATLRRERLSEHLNNDLIAWWERFRDASRLSPRISAAALRLLNRFFKIRRRAEPFPAIPPSGSGRRSRSVRLNWLSENWLYVPAENTSGRTGETFIAPDIGERLNRCLDRFVVNEIWREPENAFPSAGGDDISGLAARVALALGRHINGLLAATEQDLYRWRTRPARLCRREVCITLDRLPPDLQQAVSVHIPGPADGTGDPASPSHIVADSGDLPEPLRTDFLNAADNPDEPADGILIKSDNLTGLRHIMPGFRESVRCVYIDPPFNTGSGSFAYADRRTPEGWLTMMDNRLALARELLTPDGSIFVHIAGDETARLRLLLDRRFIFINEIIWRIGWVSGFKANANRFIRNHDTIYYYARSGNRLFNKRYMPYPEGYKRRGGGRGKGLPLEDTWNCRAEDVMHSIQIMSFSKEKTGRGDATQKNENLLERIIAAATNPGDWVLDYFAGTGTTCAAAMKTGRKWIGIELPEMFDEVLLPRMKRVLAGDPFGISKQTGWQGGGWFEYIELEPTPGSLHVTENP